MTSPSFLIILKLYKMKNLEKIVGDIIFISFKDIELFKEIGIRTTSAHYLLKGYDQMGLWLEHPGLIYIKEKDEKGNDLPVSKHTKDNISADFMVPWGNVNTLMHYPEREGYDLPSEFDKKIGFRIIDTKTNKS